MSTFLGEEGSFLFFFLFFLYGNPTHRKGKNPVVPFARRSEGISENPRANSSPFDDTGARVDRPRKRVQDYRDDDGLLEEPKSLEVETFVISTERP